MAVAGSTEPVLNISVKAARPGEPHARRIRGALLHEATQYAEDDATAAASWLAGAAGEDPAVLCEVARVCQTGAVGRIGHSDAARKLALALLDRVRDAEPTFTRALWMRGEALLTAPHGGKARPPQTSSSLLEAEELFARAAALGDPEGVFLQGRLLVTTAPEHRCKKRATHGLMLIQKAARAGVARAFVSEALCYERPDEYAPARFQARSTAEILRLYVKAAELGDALALNDIGNSIATGYAGLTAEFDAAERYYLRAIDAGAVVGYENIGTLYESGMDGMAKERIDVGRAHEYYRTGAHMRSARCSLFMGSAFDEGIAGSIKRDIRKATHYYERAFWLADEQENERIANFALKDLCALHVTKIKKCEEAVESIRFLRRYLNARSVKGMLKEVDAAIVKAKKGDDKVLVDLVGDFNAKRLLE